MPATPILERPHARLLAWLDEHAVQHELHEHPEAYTAMGTAHAEGVDPHTFAKVVGVQTDDGRRVLIVLDATDHLDLRKAREALAAHEVRLMTEAELVTLAPECAAGALPAVGALYGVPVYADHAVRSDPMISFNAGDHRFSVRVDRAAWERAAEVRYADLAEATDRRPAWVLS
jgi:Ala-tRNA(Pro) deacylase